MGDTNFNGSVQPGTRDQVTTCELDDFLAESGIQTTRVDAVENEDVLIQALQETRAQILFKRSRVPVTRRVLEACPERCTSRSYAALGMTRLIKLLARITASWSVMTQSPTVALWLRWR